MNMGRKGERDVTYLNGHTVLLYQNCARAIEPWAHDDMKSDAKIVEIV